jgi:HPt (histidine-containing phosphotransfer) domain-containing protein
MDIEMPEMDGYTAARLLRERQEDGPPIIAMTAHASADYRQRCVDAGMIDVVTKPVIYEELIETLRKYISVPKSPSVRADPVEPVNEAFDARLAIGRMNGNAALFRKLAAMFPGLHGTAANEIRSALAHDDLRKASRIAHNVGGAAGNLAATRLHAIAMKLESAAEHGEPAASLIDDFDAALKEMLLACERYVART